MTLSMVVKTDFVQQKRPHIPTETRGSDILGKVTSDILNIIVDESMSPVLLHKVRKTDCVTKISPRTPANNKFWFTKGIPHEGEYYH